jgi:hypothetical protein
VGTLVDPDRGQPTIAGELAHLAHADADQLRRFLGRDER